MITSSGAKCDVCGEFILPLDPDERVNYFNINGVSKDLHCDNACKIEVEKSFKEKDWKLLPDGPLKKLYENYNNKMEVTNETIL